MASYDPTKGVLALFDVYYTEPTATGALVLAENWQDAAPIGFKVSSAAIPAEYTSGELYKRELPIILRLLEETEATIRLLVVDGHAWLEPGRPGLGAHLYEALKQKVPVIGVAKSSFRGSEDTIHIVRGESKRPLYVTACGVDARLAADWIKSMHGPHRIPILLKMADAHSRQSPGQIPGM